jgi:NAD(P)-dependent dehydrogenase (short-subunit alcohol dehydrogenase family)
MSKTILITGSTDDIGLLTAKRLSLEGHDVLLHGRNRRKLEEAATEVGGKTTHYIADLSRIADVHAMADAIMDNYARLDVLINNAGILKKPDPQTLEGFDIRFMVNTIAPYVLTQRLLSIIPTQGRNNNLTRHRSTSMPWPVGGRSTTWAPMRKASSPSSPGRVSLQGS